MANFTDALNQIRRGALNQYENPTSALNFSETGIKEATEQFMNRDNYVSNMPTEDPNAAMQERMKALLPESVTSESPSAYLDDDAIDRAAIQYVDTGKMVTLGRDEAAAINRAKIINRAADIQYDPTADAEEFINSGNSQNAIKLMTWLKQYKLITREDGDLTRYTLNAKKTIDYETSRALMNKMSSFGISKEAAVKMQQLAEQEVNDMQFNHLGVKSKDQRLSRDQFFKKYFKEVQTSEAQDNTWQSIVYDSNGDIYPDAVSRLLKKNGGKRYSRG